MEDAFRICGADISKYLNPRDRIFMYVVGLFDTSATILPSSRVPLAEQSCFYDGIFLLVKDTKKRRDLLRRCHELNYDMNYECFMMLLLVHNKFSTFKYMHALKCIKYNIETLRIVSHFGNIKWLKIVMSGMKNNPNALTRNNEKFIGMDASTARQTSDGTNRSIGYHRQEFDASLLSRRTTTNNNNNRNNNEDHFDRAEAAAAIVADNDNNNDDNDREEESTVFQKLQNYKKGRGSGGVRSNIVHGVNFKDTQFTEIVEFCARSCYFDCTMLMLQEYGCSLNERVVSLFIRHGHSKGYSYLLKNNYIFSDVDAMDCITYGRFDWFVTYVKQHNGTLGPFTNEYIDNCIIYDRLNLLKYIVSLLGTYEKATVTSADRVELAAMYSVQCLKYLYKRSYRRWVSKHVTAQAMRTGNLRCLKFAHENNCNWHIDTMKNAARYGYLKCMKYARKHDCPWGQDVATMAATFGNYDCLCYAVKHGCPYDREKIENILRRQRLGNIV